MPYDHTTTFEHEGRTFHVGFEHDHDAGTPWENSDGNGIVSDWTTRDKRAGELVLCSDRHGRSKRFFDFQETCKIARRDGWGFLPAKMKTTKQGETWTATSGTFTCQDKDINKAISGVYKEHRATMSARAYAAGAAMKNFEYLKAWCDDKWAYVSIVVTLMDDDGEEMLHDYQQSLGGVEHLDNYAMEAAQELAGEILYTFNKEREQVHNEQAAMLEASRPDMYEART